MAADTPIPAEALEAAAKVALRRYESEFSVAPSVTWRDFVPEVRELVESVAPILLAAGRTAAAADPRVEELIRAGRAWLDELGPLAGADVEHRLADAIESFGAARIAENGADQ